VLAASGHLTDRDRDLVRLVAVHRVLATSQLAALGFGNITTARHRLSALVRLGLLRRFRPHPPTGSAPWHYVLGPVGAAMLGVEDARSNDGSRTCGPTGSFSWNAPPG
jgi:Replication-relaxation